MATVRHLSSAVEPIRELHRQIEELATHAATAYIRMTPVRVEDRNGWPCQIWYESRDLKVVSMDGCVGIEPGERFDFHPDINFFTGRNEAREVAQALLSASAYVADHPAADDLQTSTERTDI
ncbi:hypothetical protein [Mycobacteroides abscessus]|uniref:hypothetical protein n=1 Tax=Mycobacteroides abscessus TaxID=36809 RepID=UPI0009A8423D|nr:hypothetical protein [Mycobacteroides abscessus]RIS64237.1 hypothetical protein D2E70_25530 [Mycobacteroides abscessus]SKU62258.1 Uncharacterised protein [Mycobacteroides abscessus subsp. massiliense]